MKTLDKEIFAFVEHLLQIPAYRSILENDANMVLNYLVAAAQSAGVVELSKKYINELEVDD